MLASEPYLTRTMQESSATRFTSTWERPARLGEGAAAPAGAHHRCQLHARREHATEVLASFGEAGVRAEAVADRLVRELRRYLRAGVPVGEHLADQLLLPLALAGSGVASRRCRSRATRPCRLTPPQRLPNEPTASASTCSASASPGTSWAGATRSRGLRSAPVGERQDRAAIARLRRRAAGKDAQQAGAASEGAGVVRAARAEMGRHAHLAMARGANAFSRPLRWPGRSGLAGGE